MKSALATPWKMKNLSKLSVHQTTQKRKSKNDPRVMIPHLLAFPPLRPCLLGCVKLAWTLTFNATPSPLSPEGMSTSLEYGIMPASYSNKSILKHILDL